MTSSKEVLLLRHWERLGCNWRWMLLLPEVGERMPCCPSDSITPGPGKSHPSGLWSSSEEKYKCHMHLSKWSASMGLAMEEQSSFISPSFKTMFLIFKAPKDR